MTDFNVPLPRRLNNTALGWVAEHITDDAVADAPSPSTDRATLHTHHLEVTDNGVIGEAYPRNGLEKEL
jgi:hypothetical protein